ncbi:MAG: branched-chain amino acid transporter AzlC [Ruminococcaceae bacterium]|nr:branched-chain amino acid transporter AzlC [Oscillospiraceae bacterium]
MRLPNKATLKTAFLDTVPVMTGYLVLGMGFGVILQTRGYGIMFAAAMSILIYAGSMQYVAIDLITGGAGLLTAALTTLTVNARHLFYGISMIGKYRHVDKKGFLIFTLTDETYSLVCSDAAAEKQEESGGRYYFLVSLFDYAYWVTGSVIGSLLGAHLPFSTEGIDFALTALFLTVFTEQWLSTKRHAPALIGLALSVISLVIFGADSFLLFAMLFITAALALMHVRERRASHE